MTRIRWTTEAADQLEGIVKHILNDNPEAARKVARAILGRIENLKHFPRLGRPGEEVVAGQKITTGYFQWRYCSSETATYLDSLNRRSWPAASTG